MERVQRKLEANDKILVAICDDDDGFAVGLKKALEEIMKMACGAADIYIFKDGVSLLNSVDGADFQLIFLDIEMPGVNGFQTAREIMKKLANVEIVFVTGYSQFVFDSFEYRPFDFVVKENLNERLDTVARRYLEEYRRKQETILGWTEENGEKKSEYLFLRDVLYLESQGHKLILKTRKGHFYQVRMTMNEAEKYLSESGFIRVHHGYLVNGYFIRQFRTDECILDDGFRINLSRGKKEKALEAYKRLRRE